MLSLAFVMMMAPFILSPVSGQEWPAKGADVYVSASIEYEERSSTGQIDGKGTSTRIVRARPCTRLTLMQVQSDKAPWILRPWSNASSMNQPNSYTGFSKPLQVAEIRLQGPWQPRMFRSEAECLEHFAAVGEPKTSRKGPMLVIQAGG